MGGSLPSFGFLDSIVTPKFGMFKKATSSEGDRMTQQNPTIIRANTGTSVTPFLDNNDVIAFYETIGGVSTSYDYLTLYLSGNGNTVYGAIGDTIYFSGNNNFSGISDILYASANAIITASAGQSVDYNTIHTANNVVLNNFGNYNTVIVSGKNETIAMAGDDTLWFTAATANASATKDTIHFNGLNDQVNLNSNNYVEISGSASNLVVYVNSQSNNTTSNDTIVIDTATSIYSYGDNIGVENINFVGLGSGIAIHSNGVSINISGDGSTNGWVALSGNGETANINGPNEQVHVYGGIAGADDNVTITGSGPSEGGTLYGSHETLTLSSGSSAYAYFAASAVGDTATIYGVGEVLTMSGSGNKGILDGINDSVVLGAANETVQFNAGVGTSRTSATIFGFTNYETGATHATISIANEFGATFGSLMQHVSSPGGSSDTTFTANGDTLTLIGVSVSSLNSLSVADRAADFNFHS